MPIPANFKKKNKIRRPGDDFLEDFFRDDEFDLALVFDLAVVVFAGIINSISGFKPF